MNKAIRILIVEDSVADADRAQQTIRKVLKDCDFRVVKSRRKFLSALEAFQPDVILAADDLPNLGGIETGAQAQAVHTFHHLDWFEQRTGSSGLYEGGCKHLPS